MKKYIAVCAGVGLLGMAYGDVVLKANGIDAKVVDKCGEGKHDLLKLIKDKKIQLILNTPSGERSQSDMRAIRSAAVTPATEANP